MADLEEEAEIEPLVLNKQWVFWTEFPDPHLLLLDDLDEFMLERWDDARPVMEFLKEAVRNSK